MAEQILNKLVEAVNSLRENNSINAGPQSQESESPRNREAALRQLFPSIRGQASSSSSSASSSTTSSFNPKIDYTKVKQKGGSTSRGKRKLVRTNTSSQSNKSVLKDVILLPSPDIEEVPRGLFRESLYTKYYAVSAVEIADDIPEEEIRIKFNDLFERKLKAIDEPKYEFVRAIGSKIIKVKSGPFNGKVVKYLSKQGPIYIRASSEVFDPSLKRWYGGNKGAQNDESTDDECLMQPFFTNSSSDSEETRSKPAKIKKLDDSLCATTSKESVVTDHFPAKSSCSNQTYQKKEKSQQPHTLTGYDKYINILDDDDDDDDDEILAAIHASLEDQTEKSHSSFEVKALDVIKRFIDDNLDNNSDNLDNNSDNLDNNYVNIVVNRKNVLSSTLRAVQRCKFSYLKPVHITFSGEDGVDAGGPRREYFRLLMLSLKNLGVFEGKWFAHDLQLLHSKKYEMAGKLVSWSILQGGPGFKSLSSDAYLVIKDLPFNHDQAINVVTDEEIKKVLKDLQSCSTNDEFIAIKNSKAELIANYGYTQIYTSDISKKSEIQHCLLKQALLFSVHAEIEQFKNGLNFIGGFGDTVLNNPDIFNAVLSESSEKLTHASFRKLYFIAYSESGSNNRETEEKTMYCFEVFLQDLEDGEIDGLSIEDLLIFITGADRVPPLGFDNPISIEFYDMEKNVRRLPWSSTCSLTLSLPRGHDDCSEFTNLIHHAILNGVGFGKC